MTLAEASTRKLDLGRVFGDTFGVIRRQAVPLIGVTFVAGYLPSIVGGLLNRKALVASATAPFEAMSHPLYWLLAPVNLALTLFLVACQLQIAIDDLEGHSRPMSEVLRRSVSKMLPLLGAFILIGLGLMIGTMLFIVPGIIVALMWSVALPSTVADTSNPIHALGRSRALTKGNRWRILGLAVLAWLAMTIIEVMVLGMAGGLAGLQRNGMSLASLAAISLVSLAAYIVGTVGSAALYVQLRELKGAGGEHVAQVFA